MKPTVAAALLLVLGACANTQLGAERKDDLLVDAGFTKLPADQAAAMMRSLPPHRFAHRTANGAPVVYYADPVACRCVYVASQAVFNSYKSTHAAEVAAFDESVGGPSGFAS
jgi:hypothetical protein